MCAAALRLAHERGDAQRRDRPRRPRSRRAGTPALRPRARSARPRCTRPRARARASGRSSATRADSASSSVAPASPSHRRRRGGAGSRAGTSGDRRPRATRGRDRSRPAAPGTSRSASSRHSSSVSGPSGVRSTGRPSSSVSSAVGSPRTVAITSIGGASAPRNSSRRSRKLSASAHCRSSIVMTTAARARERREQLAQRDEHAAPLLVRLADSRSPAGAVAIASTRWNTGNRRTSSAARSGSSARTSCVVMPREQLREPVGDAVERLERHRLALVAAAREHHRARSSSAIERTKRATSSDLPMPDSPMTRWMRGWCARSRPTHRARRARARDRRTPAPAPASTSGARPGRRRRRACARSRRRSAARSARSRAAPCTGRTGRAAHRARARARGGGSTCCFCDQDLQRVALVRHLAGERLVEHHADAVPVRRLADLAAARLLRRHVLDGADRADRRSTAACGSSVVTRPKSRITTRPSRVTITFDGLTSRWTRPASCSAHSPTTSWRERSRAAARGRRARARGSGARRRAPS